MGSWLSQTYNLRYLLAEAAEFQVQGLGCIASIRSAWAIKCDPVKKERRKGKKEKREERKRGREETGREKETWREVERREIKKEMKHTRAEGRGGVTRHVPQV